MAGFGGGQTLPIRQRHFDKISMKARHLLLYLFPWLLVLVGALTASAQPIQYKMERDASGTYRVYMRSSTSSTAGTTRLSTAQVTILVPTGTLLHLDPNTSPSPVTSYLGIWNSNNRIDGPTITGAENGTATVSPLPNGTDFISFGMSSAPIVPGGIVAGQEVLLFSFTTTSTCSTLAQLWEPGDPTLISVGGITTNPGNQITASRMGSTGNLYGGNYGSDPLCTVADIISSLGPVPPLTVGQTAQLPVSLSNIGNGSTTAPLVFTTTLPANFTAPATFTGPNGWGCTTTGQSVSCSTTSILAPGTNTGFTIPITPLAAAVGTVPSFTGTVPTTLDGNTSNNNPAPAGSVTVLAGTTLAPDLITSLGPIPALAVGVTASIPVSVSNIGTASAAGPLTFAMTLPAGFSAAASFVSINGWGCTTTGQLVNCMAAGPLSASSSTNFSIPITPLAAAANTTPTFSGSVATASAEVSTANNTATAIAPGPVTPAVVLAPDLISSIGPVPSMTVGQTASLPVSVSNIGTGPAGGPIGFVTTLPTGFTAPATFVSINGWGCTTTGQVVSCFTAGPLSASSSTNFIIPITPTATAANTIPTFTGTPTTPTPESTTANNTSPPASPPSAVAPATVVGMPDLISSVGPVPPLSINQSASLPVSVSNIGTGPAAGPIGFVMTLPAGISAPATFANNGWGCITTGQVVSCTTSGPLNASSSTGFIIPITPGSSATGTTPTFTGTPSTPTPESTTANNPAPLTGGQTVSSYPIASTACTVSDCGIGVRYALKLGADGITYTVYMTSATSYTGASAFIPTAQATVKVPRGMQIINVTSLRPNMSWIMNTRVDGPPEVQGNLDYLSFGGVSSAATSITAGVEVPLFSFQRVGSCTGQVGLWSGYGASTSATSSSTPDAFQGGSSNTGPGNQMTIAGNGSGNAWQCNYSCPVSCPAPILTLIKLAPPTVIQTVPFNYTYIVSNIGTGPSTGQMTVVDILPPGFVFISGGGNGWTCSAMSQTVTCTSSNVIQASGSNNFPVLVVPSGTGGGSSAALTGGGSNTIVISIPCVGCPPGSTTSVVTVAPPDLQLAISAPGVLLAGQGNQVMVTVTNILSGMATGPITVTVALPAGMNAPAAFAALGGWNCITTGTNVVCSNPTSLTMGQSLSLPISVTPAASLINNPVLITATVAMAANETNGANNFGFVLSNVAGADLAVAFGAMPVLTGGQNAVVPITVNNIGQATAPGNVSLTVSLPAGVSYNGGAGLPAGWSFISGAAGPGGTTLVSLQYATSGLVSASALALNLPVSVSVGVSGSLPFSATVTPVSVEIQLSNNVATASSTVLGGPDLMLTITGPTPSLVVNQPSNIVLNILNNANQPAVGPFTTTITLPAGYSYNAGSITAGWAIGSTITNASGTTLVLNNGAASLPAFGSMSVNLTVIPPANSSGITSVITASVNPVSGETVLFNNVATLTSTPSAPGITATVLMPLSFTAGQPSNVTILFTNTGTTNYVGPVYTSITVPVGTILGPLPSGWTYGTPINNGNGTITYPIQNLNVTLNVGGSTSFLLPVTPLPTSGGTSLIILVSTPAIPSVPGSVVNITQVVPILSPPAPNVNVTIISSPTTFVVGQPTFITINLVNTGTGAVSGSTNLTFTMPAGVVLSPSQLPPGWSIISTQTGPGGTIIYVLNNTNVSILGGGGTLPIQFPVVITQPAAGTTPTIIVNFLGSPSTVPSTTTLVMPGVVGAPNMVMLVGQPTPTMTVGQTSFLSVNFSNTGTGPAFGPLTTQVVLPAGVSLNTAALNLPAGWVLSGTALSGGSTVLTFTYANNSAGFAAGSSTTFSIPVIPSGSTVNTQVQFITYLLPVSGQSTTLTQSLVTTGPVQVFTAPDLIVSATQPSPALAVGQSSSIAVTIQNIGSGAAAGPLSFQMALPTGMTLNNAQLPAGWIVTGSSAIVGGTTYTISNSSLSLAAGGSVVVNVPVTPGASLQNATMSIGLYVNAATGETLVANNGNTLIINTPVQALPTPDLRVTIPSGQSFALAVGQTSLVSFNVENIGSAAAAGSLSLQFIMPAGFTTSSGFFSSGGWSCNTFGSVVLCTNAAGLGVNASSAISVPVVPSGGAAGLVNPTFQINVLPATGEMVLANNVGTINYIGTVAGPDLAVSFPAQSFALTGGQVSSVQVLVQNLSGAAAASGPLALTFSMPGSGFFSTSPTSFNTNGWVCTTTGSTVGCTSSAGLAASGSVMLTIPVMPSVAAGGIVSNPSFVANVAPATGELNLANNFAVLNYVGPVLSTGVRLSVKAMLQGAYVSMGAEAGLMQDKLRQQSLIPLTQPYLSAGVFGNPSFTLPSNVANLATTAAVLSLTGANAIVDWVILELRSGSNMNTLVSAMPALIQRDGDVVSATDGVSPVLFAGVTNGSYYAVVRHRNHLGVMSAQAITLSATTTTYDFTNPLNAWVKPGFGTAPQAILNGVGMLWGGNASGDNTVIFQGQSSDVDPVFDKVYLAQLTATQLVNYIVMNYAMTDVNMNGTTIFQGENNEVDIIFFNVLGHPNNPAGLANFIIQQHLP